MAPIKELEEARKLIDRIDRAIFDSLARLTGCRYDPGVVGDNIYVHELLRRVMVGKDNPEGCNRILAKLADQSRSREKVIREVVRPIKKSLSLKVYDGLREDKKVRWARAYSSKIGIDPACGEDVMKMILSHSKKLF